MSVPVLLAGGGSIDSNQNECNDDNNVGLKVQDAYIYFYQNYSLVSANRLNEGAFGVVYKVKDNKTLQMCAAKKIYKHKKCKITNYRHVNVTLQDMKREVKCLMKLDHECIVKMIDFFYDDERYFLIEEYIEGGDLFDKLSKKRSYKEEDARNLIKSLLLGVQYMHNNNIVHRDIKIENLLSIEQNGQVIAKIIDFGAATELTGKGRCLHQFINIGTLQYLSPEIIEFRPYGTECDMWAIGIVTYLLLCGSFPFEYTEMMYPRISSEQCKLLEAEKIRNLIKCAKFDYKPERLWRNISDKAKNFIASLLEKDQDKRLSADQALSHEWMIDLDILDNDIPDTLAEITQSQLKRKATSVIAYYIFRFVGRLKLKIQKKRKLAELSGDKLEEK